MIYDHYAHRFADIILNSDYELRKEIDEVIRSIDFVNVEDRYEKENLERRKLSKKLLKGKQSIINAMFKEEFTKRDWDSEFPIFNDPDNDLKIDFWKRAVGVDVAFVHRSFIGGDLLRLQAGAEVKNVIKIGVYICPTHNFAKVVSPKDGPSMVNYERSRWYLKNFYAVLTVPILLIGLKE
jgi:hypothetical protein